MFRHSSFKAVTVLLALAGGVFAAPSLDNHKRATKSPITHLGTQGPILCEFHEDVKSVYFESPDPDTSLVASAVMTKDLVYTSGTVPSINGTIPEGIEAQTTAIINTISELLEEAGTTWDLALKTTVFLADMGDFQAMNAVYSSLLPNPKPARTTVQVGKLPGDFLIEIEAVVARPHC